jgi:hypothetical protein
LEPRPRVLIMMVVRLERWAGFLVTERVRLPLPFDLLLPFDLRRASLRHLTFCKSILTLKDAALISDSQEDLLICSINIKYYEASRIANIHPIV